MQGINTATGLPEGVSNRANKVGDNIKAIAEGVQFKLMSSIPFDAIAKELETPDTASWLARGHKKVVILRNLISPDNDPYRINGISHEDIQNQISQWANAQGLQVTWENPHKILEPYFELIKE